MLHYCESILSSATNKLEGTTLTSISQRILVKTEFSALDRTQYQCIDNYCPLEMPTLSESGVCVENITSCEVLNMKLTV